MRSAGWAARNSGSSGEMYRRPNEAEVVTRSVPLTPVPAPRSELPRASGRRPGPALLGQQAALRGWMQAPRGAVQQPHAEVGLRRLSRWLATAAERSRLRAAALIEPRSRTRRNKPISPIRSMIINIFLKVIIDHAGFRVG